MVLLFLIFEQRRKIYKFSRLSKKGVKATLCSIVLEVTLEKKEKKNANLSVFFFVFVFVFLRGFLWFSTKWRWPFDKKTLFVF